MYRIVALGALPNAFDDLRPSLNSRGAVAAWGSAGFSGLRALLYDSRGGRDLGKLDGYPSTLAAGINAGGTVVGVARGLDESDCRAFVADSAGLRRLETPTAGYAAARAINDSGRIVGVAATEGGTHAVVWDGGRCRVLQRAPGASASIAQHVDGHGYIVGAVSAGVGGKRRAALWRDGRLELLGVLPGGTQSHARAASDSGLIVGFADNDEAETSAVCWQNGKIRDLGTLGDEPSAAWGVNRHGHIVGGSTNGRKRMHAFVYRDGLMDDLNGLIPEDPAWQLQIAFDINDRGQIVGIGRLRGATTLFRLDPDPGAPPRPRRSEKAPDFTLTDLGGKTHSLASVRGGTMAMWFFCNCDSCHRVGRLWSAAQRDGRLKGVRTVAVFTGGAETGRAFVADTRLDRATVFLLDTQATIGTLYQAQPCPQYAVVDAGGTIRWRGKNRAPEILVPEALADLRRK